MADFREHHRVTPAGMALGRLTSMLATRGMAKLRAAGVDIALAASEPNSRLRTEMCATCACRPAVVPNGCLQTQMDLIKATVEGVPFLCHAPKDGKLCSGAIAVRAALMNGPPLPSVLLAAVKRWEFSRDDDEDANG